MWDAITKKELDAQKIVGVWNTYMKEEGHVVSQQEFIENLEKKINDQDFLGDMQGLLRIDESYDIVKAYEFIKEEILGKI